MDQQSSTNIKDCSIGIKLEEECHKTSYVRSIGLKKLDQYSLDYQELLVWRTGVQIDSVCHHHEYKYLKKYSGYHLKCCNPMQLHNSKCRKGNNFILIN